MDYSGTNKQPGVLVVILNYKTYELTIKLIEQLKNDLHYNNYSIMVVDNCSPNDSSSFLYKKSKQMGFVFFTNKNNTGYAAGNNIGIRYAIEHDFTYSWILNSDVELREKDILEHMVDIAERDPSIGCIGPKIYSPDGSICAPYIDRLTFWNMTFGLSGEKKERNKFCNKSMKVYRVHGCCMLLKNKCMKEIDCLDERTFLYSEEDILAERMLNKSYFSYYDSDVSITHKGGASGSRLSKEKKKSMISETRKSREIYLREYRHFPLWKRFICHTIRSAVIYFR